MFPEKDRNGKPLLLSYLLDCDVSTVILQGGRRCFSPDTRIVSKGKNKKISEVKCGDKVLTYNEQTGINEFKRVFGVHKTINTQKTVRIKLKTGKTIVCTEDHEFYFQGRWVKIKNILSLLNGNMETDSRI